MLASFLGRIGLSLRLIAAVTTGFLTLFAALFFLGLQALEQSSQILLREQQSNAMLLADDLDHFVSDTFQELEKSTAFAPFDPTAADLSEERYALAHLYQLTNHFSVGISFIDRSGKIILTEPVGFQGTGFDLLGADHIREALDAGHRTISVPHLDLRLGRPIVAFTVPVKDRSGQVTALLTSLVDLKASPISRTLATAVARGGTTHTDVFSANGTVVASSKAGQMLQPAEHLEFYLRSFRAGVPATETVRDDDGDIDEHHVMSFVPLRSAPWGLGLGASTDEVFAAINSFRRTLLTAGGLCLLAVLSLTLAGAQILVRPVLALTLDALRMANGDLSKPIAVSAGAEIGLLAESLEGMRQRLAASLNETRELNNSLEERVHERTVELQDLNRELTTTASVTAHMNASLDLDEVLQNGLRGVLDVVKADGGAIWLSEPGDKSLRLRIHRGVPAEFVAQEAHLACGDCLCGLVATAGRPLVINELAQHPPGPTAMRMACQSAGFTALLLVPLASKGQVQGVLLLGSSKHSFSEYDVRIVTAVANHLSVAVENAQLYEQIQQKETHLRHLLERIIDVQEEERKRIARELHDETGQALTALIMGLEGTTEAMPVTQEPLRSRLVWAQDMARASLEDIRTIILDLRPSALDDLGLVAALRRYAEARLTPLGVHWEVKAGDYHEGLIPETDIILFRIGQEAMNNVARHAAATHVRIEVRRQGDRVELTVQDNGQGFDWQEVEQSGDPMRGLGLMGMRERAALFGGTCEIVSRPGRGTSVQVSVPVMEKEQARLE